MKRRSHRPALALLTIVTAVALSGCHQGPDPTSAKALLRFVHRGGPRVAATPFHLTYNDNGLVIRVQEQSLP